MPKLFKFFFIFILIFYFTEKAYDSSEKLKQFVQLLNINDYWINYWYDYYNLKEYVDSITGQNLKKRKIQNLGIAIMKWESNFNNKQIVYEKKVNGYSYGQYGLLSTTAKSYGWKGTNEKELLEANINAKYATKFLCNQIAKYEGNIEEALAAYNAGKARYDKKGILRNYNYVENVYYLYVKINKKIK